jgi:hypothetical protein
MTYRFNVLLSFVVLLLLLSGGNLAGQQDDSTYRQLILDDHPVAYWSFDQPATSAPFSNQANAKVPSDALAAEWAGQGQEIVAGPTSKNYPLFSETNLAIQLNGKTHLRIADPGDQSALDFSAGDAITIEAWVKPDRIDNGQFIYVIGKGRTGDSSFDADNQNYALRLAGSGSMACVSFLFRNADRNEGSEKSFHRWTATNGFAIDNRWHHVAISYQFGDSKSIRGYLDGESLEGKWDLAGATNRAPVVDNDELWIGGAKGGSNDNSFSGSIDEVAIYRSQISADRIAQRYQSNLPSAYEQFTKDADIPDGKIYCEIIEQVPLVGNVSLVTTEFTNQRFALNDLPRRYNGDAVIEDRENSFDLQMRARLTLPVGKQRLLLRSKSRSRLFIGKQLVAQLGMMSQSFDGHEQVPELVEPLFVGMHPLPAGHQETVVEIEFTSSEPQMVRLETMIGGKELRAELGELCVAIAPAGTNDFRLLAVDPEQSIALSESAWYQFALDEQLRMRDINQQLRLAADSMSGYWQDRHDHARDVIRRKTAVSIPAGDYSTQIHNDIDRLINAQFQTAGIEPTEIVNDYEFIKRLSLDTVGVIPTLPEIQRFLQDQSADRRAHLIDRYLADPRWADHWVGYWQDVLAENPGIVKPKLNNTGPFRFWIYESMLDNKPIDRFAWELIMLSGGKLVGGPSGFGVATENDVPMAEKAHTLSKAFLAMDMKCARCHDAPSHDFKQQDLFSVAAMLQRTAIKLPESSTVPLATGARVPAVEISLKPGALIKPDWPFSNLGKSLPDRLQRNPNDSRAQLASAMTSPENPRFAQVIVNRLWHRLFERGLMNPIDDWENSSTLHPELLEYLADEFVANSYDLKHVARLILNSATYQRQTLPESEQRRIELFAGHQRRRLTAEQMVDSLYAAVGKQLDAEQLTLDPEGRRNEGSFINLGVPYRAWQFTSLSNERDRPSLALPVAQSVVDLLSAFGWRDSRQSPQTIREDATTVIQPLSVANGTAGHRLVQLSDNSLITNMCIDAKNPQGLADDLFLQVLSRPPNSAEKQLVVELLREGFEQRVHPAALVEPPVIRRNAVSWSNHLSEEASRIKLQMEAAARQGDLVTQRLDPQWRMSAEDALWALLNSPEFVFVP